MRKNNVFEKFQKKWFFTKNGEYINNSKMEDLNENILKIGPNLAFLIRNRMVEIPQRMYI